MTFLVFKNLLSSFVSQTIDEDWGNVHMRTVVIVHMYSAGPEEPLGLVGQWPSHFSY